LFPIKTNLTLEDKGMTAQGMAVTPDSRARGTMMRLTPTGTVSHYLLER
jgi:hypothetical protein